MQSTISANPVVAGETDHHFLRRVLIVDGLFCAISGIEMAVFAQPTATFLGVDQPFAIIVIGLALLAVSAFIFLTLRAKPLPAASIRLLVGGNVAWVVSSFALLVADMSLLSNGGKLAIVVQAFLTADVAFFEWMGWRRGR